MDEWHSRPGAQYSPDGTKIPFVSRLTGKPGAVLRRPVDAPLDESNADIRLLETFR